MTDRALQPGPAADPFRHTLVAFLVAAAFFMEMLDGTVIATALPQMAESFHVSAIQLSTGITAYMLTVAVFLPANGWFADRFGTRTVFASAIGAFTVSSVACGISPDFYTFLLWRVVQGAAAALMSPVGRLIVLRTTEKHQLLRAAAITTWPALLAPVVGPPLGGFITTYASWRWIFFLNVPLGMIGAAMVLRFVANFRDRNTKPFDVRGFVLTGLALAFLMFGFDRMGVREWWAAGASTCAGILLGWLAVRHAERTPHPIVELSAMRIPSFSIGVWGGILFRIAVGATPILLPLMFQRGFGMTAFAAGVLTLGYAIGNLGMKPFTTPILRFFGFRATLIGTGLLSALTIALCGLIAADTPQWATMILLILTGGFRSLGLTALFTLPFVDVTPPQRSAASTMVSVVQQVGFGLGVAFGTVALQAALLLRGAGSDALTVPDFRMSFVAVAAVGALAILTFARLPARAGAEVSGHQPVKAARRAAE